MCAIQAVSGIQGFASSIYLRNWLKFFIRHLNYETPRLDTLFAPFTVRLVVLPIAILAEFLRVSRSNQNIRRQTRQDEITHHSTQSQRIFPTRIISKSESLT